MRVALALVYIAVLHGIVALALLRPDLIDAQRWRASWLQPEPSAYGAQSHRLFRAIDADAAPGRLLLAGDSQLQRLDTAALDMPAYNFAAGGDTMRDVARRIADYRQPGEAKAVVLWAGVNDLLRGRDPEAVRAAFEQAEAAIPARLRSGSYRSHLSERSRPGTTCSAPLRGPMRCWRRRAARAAASST